MKIKSIALALSAVVLAACSTLSHGSASADQSQATVLQMENLGFQDMDVYAVRRTTLRFIADPIGGRRASVSQEITVGPGDTVVMTIPPG
jgi:hypothetical protein